MKQKYLLFLFFLFSFTFIKLINATSYSDSNIYGNFGKATSITTTSSGNCTCQGNSSGAYNSSYVPYTNINDRFFFNPSRSAVNRMINEVYMINFSGFNLPMGGGPFLTGLQTVYTEKLIGNGLTIDLLNGQIYPTSGNNYIGFSSGTGYTYKCQNTINSIDWNNQVLNTCYDWFDGDFWHTETVIMMNWSELGTINMLGNNLTNITKLCNTTGSCFTLEELNRSSSSGGGNSTWNQTGADSRYYNLANNISWTNLSNFPTYCPAGSYLTGLNTSTICTIAPTYNNDTWGSNQTNYYNKTNIDPYVCWGNGTNAFTNFTNTMLTNSTTQNLTPYNITVQGNLSILGNTNFTGNVCAHDNAFCFNTVTNIFYGLNINATNINASVMNVTTGNVTNLMVRNNLTLISGTNKLTTYYNGTYWVTIAS